MSGEEVRQAGTERLAEWMFDAFHPGLLWGQATPEQRRSWLRDAKHALTAVRNAERAAGKVADDGTWVALADVARTAIAQVEGELDDRLKHGDDYDCGWIDGFHEACRRLAAVLA